MDIKELHQEGHSVREISRMTGYARNTVRRVLRGEHDLKMKQAERTSKLDAFKPYLKERYEAFGEVRAEAGTAAVERGFSGQIAESTSGLIRMGFRHYNAATGRFLQADPLQLRDQSQQLHLQLEGLDKMTTGALGLARPPIGDFPTLSCWLSLCTYRTW
jgi:RHS repeat-associated protein